ncbi:anti-sigma factor [Dactylosporangium sp. CA-233914]|uniref:anti-sigma factor n=1 Tax=Dactylosporangium sp. CA-233914 TaxID=3239934 RepID=UPI003D9225BE
MSAPVDIHALVGAYALDAVDDLERVAFERHLRDCTACAAEVAELRETAGWLAAAVAEPPPARMRDAVLARIGSTPQERPKRPPTGSGRADRNRVRRWAVSAAAAVVLAAAASAGTWAVTRDHFASQSSQIDAVLAAADAHLVSQEVEGGRITMIVSPSHDAGVAVLSGLRTPDGSYQLWMIDAAPRPVALTESGTGRFYIRGLAPTFGVSKEPKGGSKTPTEVVGKLDIR